MQNKQSVVIGVDVGTQGVRTIALNDSGELVSSRSSKFPLSGAREEQQPAEWWSALVSCLNQLAGDITLRYPHARVEALSVTSTSGTMIALDKNLEPLSPAIMYSDSRSKAEAARCRAAALSEDSAGYTAFNSSSGLPKIVWFIEQHAQLAEKIHIWAHAADYIIGKLSDVWGITDYSNSLKSGYDLIHGQWPGYITEKLNLPGEWFPKVVVPGTVLGTISTAAAALTGLPRTLKIVAGMTDGCTSQIASGAISPGDWSTTIGTTLVVKGVTRHAIEDPLGRLYNHKHPQGYWMPGGASNTGGDWIAADYAQADLNALNAAAEAVIPTPWISYPLLQQGERFPFHSDLARGFDPQGLTPEQLFAARMEGVAYLERLSYEMIESLSGERVNHLYTAGGGSNSGVWLSIRSSVLRRPINKMRYTEGAVGAAVLAASQTLYGNLEEACKAMLRLEEQIEPMSEAICRQYDDNYLQFKQQLRDKGYLHAEGGGERI
ncbi:FGGY-family carbohydrate kinase [Paenibacillus piri]|uniref:Carbohydrate kinase n=1 Tax=Paenibacillus piri TaxID=2547395 RepID=A0A4R5KSH9_9BACL|nr:FGGY-family carbohydrate kinase [Paenibacillus piri]TDF97965.1 carbohydrate kinase [Paenibacillus piri]